MRVGFGWAGDRGGNGGLAASGFGDAAGFSAGVFPRVRGDGIPWVGWGGLVSLCGLRAEFAAGGGDGHGRLCGRDDDPAFVGLARGTLGHRLVWFQFPVIRTYTVGFSSIRGQGKGLKRIQVFFFYLPLRLGHQESRFMNLCIAGAFQPALSLFVEESQVNESSAVQKVTFYKFHDIFNFAFVM